jgi:pimeloyl-ACP methyl ester carboxylesterase
MSAETIPDAAPVPFVINTDAAALEDLQARLAHTRWPIELGDNSDWLAGANLDYMRELTAYWQNDFDFRAQERKINAFAQFRARIDGVPVHFIHERGRGPNPIPIILNHGWPWTFWDLHKIIGPLSDPAAYGGDAADSFDVIVPSLPGFGYSSPLTQPGMNFFGVADLWPKLMRMLGYTRYAVQGGDIGAMVAARMGHKFAGELIGVHLHFIMPFMPPFPDSSDYGPDESGWEAKNETFMSQGAGYMALQTTRPQTLAFALHDSPVGLAAWLVEKRHAWSDHGGDFESVFSKDDLLTSVMIYWLTETYVTSARHYYEAMHNVAWPEHNRLPAVEAPTAVIQFQGDVMLRPRKWAETYYNLQRWNVVEKGGHFAPMETPAVLVDDIREFFRPRRSPA